MAVNYKSTSLNHHGFNVLQFISFISPPKRGGYGRGHINAIEYPLHQKQQNNQILHQ